MMLPRFGVLLACLLVLAACDVPGQNSPTNGGTLDITVISTPQGWRVARYEQAT